MYQITMQHGVLEELDQASSGDDIVAAKAAIQLWETIHRVGRQF